MLVSRRNYFFSFLPLLDPLPAQKRRRPSTLFLPASSSVRTSREKRPPRLALRRLALRRLARHDSVATGTAICCPPAILALRLPILRRTAKRHATAAAAAAGACRRRHHGHTQWKGREATRGARASAGLLGVVVGRLLFCRGAMEKKNQRSRSGECCCVVFWEVTASTRCPFPSRVCEGYSGSPSVKGLLCVGWYVFEGFRLYVPAVAGRGGYRYTCAEVAERAHKCRSLSGRF